MLDLLSGFVTELRRSGLPVSLTEHLDAAEAVKHIPLEDREALKYALAATLVKSSAHWRAFETAFEVFFAVRTRGVRRRRRSTTDGDGEDGEGEGEQAGQGGPQGQGRSWKGGGSGEGMTPEELAELLFKSLHLGRCRADERRGAQRGRPLRRHGAGAPRRGDVLPVPHPAEPGPRCGPGAADGPGPGRRRGRVADRPGGAPGRGRVQGADREVPPLRSRRRSAGAWWRIVVPRPWRAPFASRFPRTST